MIIRDDNVDGFAGLTTEEYKKIKTMFESNGIAVRVTACSNGTCDIQFYNPYKYNTMLFDNLKAKDIQKISLRDIVNYNR